MPPPPETPLPTHPGDTAPNPGDATASMGRHHQLWRCHHQGHRDATIEAQRCHHCWRCHQQPCRGHHWGGEMPPPPEISLPTHPGDTTASPGDATASMGRCHQLWRCHHQGRRDATIEAQRHHHHWRCHRQPCRGHHRRAEMPPALQIPLAAPKMSPPAPGTMSPNRETPPSLEMPPPVLEVPPPPALEMMPPPWRCHHQPALRTPCRCGCHQQRGEMPPAPTPPPRVTAPPSSPCRAARTPGPWDLSPFGDSVVPILVPTP